MQCNGFSVMVVKNGFTTSALDWQNATFLNMRISFVSVVRPQVLLTFLLLLLLPSRCLCLASCLCLHLLDFSWQFWQNNLSLCLCFPNKIGACTEFCLIVRSEWSQRVWIVFINDCWCMQMIVFSSNHWLILYLKSTLQFRFCNFFVSLTFYLF